MSRPLDLTQREITAICKGAAKAGFVPVLQKGNTVIRLFPDTPASLAQDERPIVKGKVVDL